jgi:pimeloyl-ACP methyl ester carboxylesterase
MFWSYPGRPQPFLDAHGDPLAGSISEKVFLDINGVRQGMFVKGKNVRNPVLLYLHGGMPDYFLTQKYPTGLEDHFTIVWWEQRGAGLSYRPDIPRETLTTEQLISDTLAVTNYLRNRFGQDRIYLMAHSGGTFIGIQAAARAPELYHAYIGVAQTSNQLNSEQLAYEYMLQRFRENGDTGMVRKLEASPVSSTGGTPAAYLALRDDAMHRLGVGTMHDMTSVAGGIFLESLKNRDYTMTEKINLWRGKMSAGVSAVWDEMITTDLSEAVPRLAVPVYFFEGSYDFTCSSTEARAYFDRLQAPVKGFYTFEQSAHSPMFEEPQKTVRIMREDVLAGANRLADTNLELAGARSVTIG